MKNNIIKEIIVSFAVIVLAVLLLNPFHFWMPDMMVVAMLAVTLVLFGMFASFILRERVFDERDTVNRSLAGRNAFLVGSAVLLLGIIIEGYSHSVDTWLVVAFIAMIMSKVFSRVRSDWDLK